MFRKFLKQEDSIIVTGIEKITITQGNLMGVLIKTDEDSIEFFNVSHFKDIRNKIDITLIAEEDFETFGQIVIQYHSGEKDPDVVLKRVKAEITKEKDVTFIEVLNE